ncbi:MAG: hypothetical protein ABIA93_04995 [Candidatus Woesearchaeota archaeon]
MRIKWLVAAILAIPSALAASPVSGIGDAFGNVLDLLGRWFSNPEIRFFAMLVIVLVLTYRIIAGAPLIRQHAPLRKGIGILVFIVMPIWVYTFPNFKKMIIADMQLLVLGGIAIVVLFVLTNIAHLGGWGLTGGQVSARRFKKYTSGERRERKDVERDVKKEEKELKHLSKEERAETKTSKKVDKILKEVEKAYAEAFGTLRDIMHSNSDPSLLEEHEKHRYDLRIELIPKLRIELMKEYEALNAFALGVMKTINLQVDEEKQIREDMDAFFKEEHEAERLGDAFKGIGAREAKQGIQGMERVAHLEAQAKDHFKDAYRIIYDAVKRLGYAIKSIEHLGILGDDVRDERLATIQNDYNYLRGEFVSILNAVNEMRDHCSRLIAEGQKLVQESEETLKKVDAEKKQEEKLTEELKKEANAEAHMRT